MQNGEKTAALSVATSEKWTDKQTGVKKESTEWHRVVLYRRLAEITEIIAEQVQMLSSSEKNTQTTAENKPQAKQKDQEIMTADEQKDIQQFDDDIPF